MKMNINWKRWAVMALVAFLLIILTGSFFMSLGIFMVLLLIDSLLGQWEKKRKDKDDE
ncbi:MAG: hypothetical protein ACMV14_05210 [Prevotella sp.]|jgi:hypothetical protein|nr:hypothetical protein [Prevotella sp.]